MSREHTETLRLTLLRKITDAQAQFLFSTPDELWECEN